MLLSRRQLLKTFGAATAVCHGFVEAVSAIAADPKAADSGTVLVLVQLAGGNDGLNTVVPYADDLYAKNRRTLRLGAKQVLKIDQLVGFHPEMTAFKRLYDDGLLSVVQGIGYSNPHGGHTESMRFWHTARPHEANVQTGWVGRAADLVARPGDGDLPGVFVGRIRRPFIINAERSFVPAIRDLEHAALSAAKSGDLESRPTAVAARGVGENNSPLPSAGEGQGVRAVGGNPLLTLVQQTATAADASSRRLDAVVRSARPGRAYPQSEFGQMLKAVADLIRAELGVRIFVTELGGEEPGGWDTHAVQFANHAALLKQLSEGMAAFAADLKADRLLDRVVLATYSEFGRTLAENGRRGTDHGSAAPMFLLGGKLKGGLVGPHPNLAMLEGGGGVRHHTDFRRVYATLIDRWLGWDSRPILGGAFAPLDLLKT